jgi:ubiquinol-cytochrome c reductase cytochrome b subunit
MPGFDVTLGDCTLVPDPFWDGVLFPTVVMLVMALWPWIERRVTGDRAGCNPLDARATHRAARRSAFGVAFFTWSCSSSWPAPLTASTSSSISYEGPIAFYRAFVWVAPVLAFVVTRRICRELQLSDAIRAERERAEHEARQATGVGPTVTVADA